jgi:hypothetical protein
MRETDLGFKSSTGKDIKADTNFDITEPMAADMERTYRNYEANLQAEEDAKKLSRAEMADNRQDKVNSGTGALRTYGAKTPGIITCTARTTYRSTR